MFVQKNKSITVVLALLLVALFTACQPGGNEPGAPADGETPAPANTPAEEATPESQYPAGVEAARQQLAADLDVEPEAITVASFEAREWPDACLGLPEEGQMCAEVITPGYLVALNAEDQIYSARTNQDGSVVVFEGEEGERGDLPGAVVAARQALAEQLGMSPDQIEVIAYEQQEWSDSCLGLGGPDEACLQVITPGWQVTLGADGQAHEFRTDETGDAVRAIDESLGETGDDLPQAVVAARQALADALRISADEVTVTAYEQREWSDSCLGLGGPAESCLQAITPGWQVTLEANGESYELRTDETGDAVRAVDFQLGGPGAGLPDAVVTFERSGGIAGDLVQYFIYPDGQVEMRTGLPQRSQPVELVGMAPEDVGPFVQDLKNLGFAEVAGDYIPEETCCDRFFYTVTLNTEDEHHTIQALGDAEETPDAVWEIIDTVEQFIQEVSESG